MSAPNPGKLYGVGLGPGDPDLVTLKAARVLAQAPVVAWFAKAGARSHAYGIAAGLLKPGCAEMPLTYPVTTEFPVEDPRYAEPIAAFYAEAAEAIAQRLSQGQDVAVLCAGDPFFYGSFMHLYHRLVERFAVQVIPGIPAMAGSWARSGQPITWGDDILTVLPGTLPEVELTERLGRTDAAVIMKLGRNLPHVRRALRANGLEPRAIYVEYGTMQAERIMPLADKADDKAPYFSLILLPGRGRRL